MKEFNEKQIKTAFKKFPNLQLFKEFIKADYSQIGVFVDARCNYTVGISTLFSEVFKDEIYDKKIDIFF